MGNQQCGACGNCYSSTKNGGVEFKNQPESFVCGSCGAPKSGFKEQSNDQTPVTAGAKVPVQAPEVPAAAKAAAPAPAAPGEPLRESLRGSERKKVSKLENIDPWASYTKGVLLGEGQFAEVYLITDNSTGVEYACKILCKASPLKDEHLDREVEVMLNASHPYLCTVHRIFMHNGVLHLVMDIIKPVIQGQSADLFTWIMNKDAQPTEREVATIIHRVALAVQYLNQPPLSCMHDSRDLKPGNVLVGQEGITHLKVADFGMARMDVVPQAPSPRRGLRRAMTAKAGTAAYMAAEVISGDYGDNPFKVDIFSIGCVAYVSLKQQFPFGDEQYSCFRKIGADDWDHCETDQHTDWDCVSDGCKHAIRKMMARDQDDRYSIDELLADPWVTANAIPM